MAETEEPSEGLPAIPSLRTLSRPLNVSTCVDGSGDLGLLMEVGGPNSGRAHHLGEGRGVLTVGRDASCGILFDEGTLSRIHARIGRDGDTWFIEDAGSRNGTFVNNARVGRAALEHGDRVRLGYGVSLLFHRVTAAEAGMLVHLYEAGVRDGLTGAFNRRYLSERLEEEVAYALRHGTSLGLLMLDLDHFKRINDSKGHLAGDEVLQHVVKLCRRTIRPEDTLARFGGEEFVLVFRDTSFESLCAKAESLRALIEASPAWFEDGAVPVTVSIGAALLADCSNPSAVGLLATADAALYRAKQGGRNRVESA